MFLFSVPLLTVSATDTLKIRDQTNLKMLNDVVEAVRIMFDGLDTETYPKGRVFGKA